MSRRGIGPLALVLVLARPSALRADPPSPPCLPPRRASCEPREKKDERATVARPRLHAADITVFNVHTREAVVLGAAASAGERELLERLLRDRTNWEEHAIAPGCIATMRAACAALHGRRVEIISGYRSDKLNESLRKHGRHVARNSQHTQGNALDLRLAGVSTEDLIRFVRREHRGGTGYYPQSGFVHIDVGPRRRWQGE